jgi:hypothetical protein
MIMNAPGRFNSKALTGELRKLAQQAVTIDDEGNAVTREQKLAELLWNLAIGYTEAKRDPQGNLKEVKHEPVAWAVQMMFDRMEGRPQVAVQENETGIKAVDKVRELSKQRLNAIASAKIGPPKKKAKVEA